MNLPLTGSELLAKVEQLKDQPKAVQVRECGYVREGEKLLYTAFYEALIEAKGLTIDDVSVDSEPVSRGCCYGPAIYVACLASYNSGLLYGYWLNLSNGPSVDEIKDAISLIIKESPTYGAEEYAIHDTQLLPSFLSREYASISEIAAYCENWAELEDSDTDAYEVFCENTSTVETIDDFRESFSGYYKDEEEFAAEYVEEFVDFDSLPELIRYAIDCSSVWRDLSSDFWKVRTGQGLAIFYSN